MAWPKKRTRKLVIHEEVWHWHTSGHCYLCSCDVVTVGRKSQPYYLFLDTLSAHFVNTPGHVAAAIRWALDSGWSPETGPDRGIYAAAGGFQWLPEGVRRGAESHDSPVKTREELRLVGAQKAEHFPREPRPLLSFRLSQAEVIRRLGAPHREGNMGENGTDTCLYWAFLFDCKLEVYVKFILNNPLGQQGDVSASAPDVPHVLQHLPVSDATCWRADRSRPAL